MTGRRSPCAAESCSVAASMPQKKTIRASPAFEAAPKGEGLRMRDLVSAAGLPRETIHFYLAQGLLPKPLKTGRNTAVYGAEHLDRLLRIKELQDRHFLPLRAIKAVLEDNSGGAFSEEQQAILTRVRASLPTKGWRTAETEVPLSSFVPSRVTREDVDAIKRMGIIDVKGRGAGATVSAEDARILDCWASLLGLLTPNEPLPGPDMLANYEDAMAALVAREARLLTQVFPSLSGERAVELIDSSEPVLERLLAALRRKKIAALLHDVSAADPAGR